MNQILAISNESKSKSKTVEISKIVKFFAITIIIFSIFLIGTASYALYKVNNTNSNISVTKPQIQEEYKDESTILLKIMHDKSIDKVEYYWNNDEVQTIEGNGRKYIEQVITIPGGVNILNVRAVDVNGQEIFFPKEYKTEDIIKLDVISGGKLKITAETEQKISYMTYRWGEELETKIDINSQNVDQEIDIPLGDHTLTVVLVDENNKSIIKKQDIKGITIPNVEVSLDSAIENYIIKVTDEIPLDRVELILNGEDKYRVKVTDTQIEFPFELREGENKLEVTAYNSEGVASKTVKVKCKK